MKKYYILLFLLCFLCNKQFLINAYGTENKMDLQEKLAIELLNAKSREERMTLLEDNKEIVDVSIVRSLDVKSLDKNLSKDRKKEISQIAIEVAELIGDKALIAELLCNYSYRYELFTVENYTPPGLKRALVLYKEIENRKGEASCYYEQSLILWRLSCPEKSLEFLEKAFIIYTELNDDRERARCYSMKSSIYEDMGEIDNAIDNMKYSIELYEKSEDSLDNLRKFNYYKNLRLLYSKYGFPEKAMETLEIQKKFIEKLSPVEMKFCSREELMVEYYSSMGRLYLDRGNYEEALSYFQKAIEMGNNKFLYYSTPKNMIGLTYLFLGQQDMAVKYYIDAISTADSPEDLISSNIYLARLYLKMKRFGDAEKCFEIAMEASEKMEDEEERVSRKASCLEEMSSLYLAKGEVYNALLALEEACHVYEKLYKDNYRYRTVLIYIYEKLGEVYQKTGDNVKALFYMKKSFEFAEKSNMYVMAANCNAMGNFYLDDNKSDEALKYYLQSIKIYEQVREVILLWQSYFAVGKVYESRGNLEKSYEYYKKSIEIIEDMRNRMKVEEFKRDFMEDKIEVYEHMINILMKLHREKEAFEYNERARARAFLDSLANCRIDPRKGGDEKLITKAEDLQNRIDALGSNIKEERIKPVMEQRSIYIENTDKELNKLKSDYEHVMEEMKLKNSEYLSLISVNPIPLKEIQEILDKDTIILEYFLCKDKGFLWITGRDCFYTVNINLKRESIETLIKEYRDLSCDNMTVEKLNDNRWKKVSARLYDILFKDGEKFVSGKKRLVIAPHGVLNYLPFEILLNGKGDFMVKKYEMVYIPSASTLKFCRNNNKSLRKSLLAFAIGDFKTFNLSPLPNTKKEVKAISVFFNKKEIFYDENMKSAILYEKSKDYDILHLATHGTLDSQSPLFSSLVFADKRLYVYEIFNLDLKSSLVSLSACRTAMGEASKGDEIVGLSRAFIYAGTPSICSSLWDVSDISTSELMERFYYYLKQGKTKSNSLRLAQLDTMKKYHHPFFWAPFILIGDWN